jgi:hypothetical protein
MRGGSVSATGRKPVENCISEHLDEKTKRLKPDVVSTEKLEITNQRAIVRTSGESAPRNRTAILDSELTGTSGFSQVA